MIKYTYNNYKYSYVYVSIYINTYHICNKLEIITLSNSFSAPILDPGTSDFQGPIESHFNQEPIRGFKGFTQN